MNISKQLKNAWIFFILLCISIVSKAQYCPPVYTSGCSGGAKISYFEVGSLSNSTNLNCNANSYEDFTAISSPTLVPNQFYNFIVGIESYNAYFNIWIDFNDNNVFESSESVAYVTNAIFAATTATVNAIIPITANPGNHRLRVRVVESVIGNTIDPCNSYTWGETEDYSVYIQPLPSCTSTPYGGFAIANPSLTCVNTSINLSLISSTQESGITYQWQKSTNSGTTWSNLGTSQNGYAYTVPSQSINTQYRCILTCTNGGISDTSNFVSVNQLPLINCYCTPSYMECGNGEYIQSLSFAAITDGTIGCVSSGYSDRSFSVTTPTLNAGQSYPYSIDVFNTSNVPNTRLAYWIDANQNGIFENFEKEILSTSTATFANVSGNITIPSFALSGDTKIRFKYENSYSSITGEDACVDNGYYGTTLDYVLNIVAAPSCTGTPLAGNVISSETAVCTNVGYQLNLNGTSIASGLTFQWQVSSNGTSGWTNIGNPEIFPNYSVSSQTATTYYRNIVTCSNSGLSSTSSTLAVIQRPFYECYCLPNTVSCQFAYFNDLLFSNIQDTLFCNLTTGINSSTLTANVNANQTYTFSANVIGGGGFAYVGLWIDYDQNGSFDNHEFSYIDSSCCSTVSNIVNIPFTAKGGLTGMRIHLIRDYSSIPNFNPCYTNYYEGQFLNYFVNITPVAPCSSTPNSGLATSTKTSVCTTDEFELSLAGNSINSNISYQWQSSPDNISWTNMSTVQYHVNFLSSPQTTSTYYRCITTCISSSSSSTSTPVMIVQKAPTDCYCIPPNIICTNNFGQITNINVDGVLNNSSTCSTNGGYSDYTQSVVTSTFSPGNTYSITVTTVNNSSEQAYLWIDYDKNGIFDSYEYFFIGNNYSNSVISNSFTIPTSVSSGITRMRIRTIASNSIGSNDACSTPNGARALNNLNPQTSGFSDGETEDYAVFITLPNCSLVNTPSIINASITQSVICSGDQTVLDITPQMPAAIGYTYDWLYSNDGINYSPVVSANTTSSLSAIPSQNYYYICTVSCNSNTVITTTNPATVTVNTTTLNISSPSTSICPGQIITLTATGATSYTWSTSAQTETISVNPLTTTSYSVSGKGINGCIGNTNFLINVALATAIQGTVSESGNPVSGDVILFKFEPMFTKFDTTGVQVIAANGSYNFPSILYGSYIVMAVPTATNLQVTYGLNALGWKNATINTHACANDDIQNINVVPFLTVGTGPGLMSGQIIEGIGFGQKPNGTMAPSAPGNPIGGIIVKGGKNPGGNFFTQTVTDAAGGYTLSSLPVNNPGEEYFVMVEIPGLDTNGTYERQITSTDNLFTGLNFVVDNEKINTIQDVSVQSIDINSTLFKVYPNPANDKFTINFKANSDSNTKIELLDIIGRKMASIYNNKTFKSDSYEFDVNTKNINSGIYFIKIDINGSIQTIKIIIQN